MNYFVKKEEFARIISFYGQYGVFKREFYFKENNEIKFLTNLPVRLPDPFENIIYIEDVKYQFKIDNENKIYYVLWLWT